MPDSRIAVAVIFGGRSAEHQVSVVSARSVLAAMDAQKYTISLIGIDLDGGWHFSHEAEIEALLDGEIVANNKGIAVSPDMSQPGRLLTASSEPLDVQIGVVFPVLHGTFGEDGTIQGLFEMWGVPYVGCGVAASANGMDKVLAKQLFEIAEIPQNAYVVADYSAWQADADALMAKVGENLDYPCFVKPANLGSSVGISRCTDRDSLEKGLALAFEFDNKVLVEAAFEGGQEIECAVLGNAGASGSEAPQASVVGEIKAGAEFYDYDAKYVDDSSEIIIPADLPVHLADTVREYAVSAFEVLGGSGLARVDFFVEVANEKVAINEVNTLPGFTPISMYPKMWAASGLSYPALIDMLVSLAFQADKQKRRLRRSY